MKRGKNGQVANKNEMIWWPVSNQWEKTLVPKPIMKDVTPGSYLGANPTDIFPFYSLLKTRPPHAKLGSNQASMFQSPVSVPSIHSAPVNLLCSWVYELCLTYTNFFHHTSIRLNTSIYLQQ